MGVALVQIPHSSPSPESTHQNQNQLLGVVAVLISCLSSGFAGVYFEMMLKGSDETVWLRNVQLGMFGSLTALIGMFVKDGAEVYKNGPLYGYTPLVWFVISQQAIGGLVVALVVRYADNILKGFATSLSIILSCVASVFLFNYVITFNFSIGAFLVIVAIYLYGRAQPSSPPEKKPSQSPLPQTNDDDIVVSKQ